MKQYAAWITLGLSCTFTTSLIYLVHRQQRVEKKVKTKTVHVLFVLRLLAGNESWNCG